ncbi:MAG: aldolase [Chitinophagaceae bacterium]|nr:aldolase [Chitinophagaceae bacterium]
MKKYKLNRLFNASSGRCFDVAIDHGFFNELSFLKGIENIEGAVKTLLQAAPDAIQLTVGQAHHLQSVPGRNKPALVLRTDVANVYGTALVRPLFSTMIENPVLQAIKTDATAVVVNLFSIPGESDLARQCIQNIAKLKQACDQYDFPLMIEPLVFSPDQKNGGYAVDGNIDKILPLVRQAVELGADIIKADPTEDISGYHRVIEMAGNIPVLVRGGGKAPDKEILERTYEVIRQGASGIVYGRNVVQHRNPAGITRALMAIVHENAKPGDVLGMLD